MADAPSASDRFLTPGTETDDPSIFRQEAHIVAQAPGGPRAGDLDKDRLDSHENLILLCSEHHMQVDDQPDYYTVERLRQIKQRHKEWVASHDVKDLDPLRIVPDPIFPRQHLLKMIFSGNVLREMVNEAVAIQYGLPDHLREEDEEIVVEFLDLVRTTWTSMGIWPVFESNGTLRKRSEATSVV